VVSNWQSAGTNITPVANWTAENTGSNLAISTTIATYEIENIAVDTASVKNIGLFIHVDDTDATIGDFIEIGDVQIECGPKCTAYEDRAQSIDTQLSLRTFRRICDAGGSALNDIAGFGMAYSTTQLLVWRPLEVPMRVTPTLTV